MDDRARRFLAEATIGVLVAFLILVVAAASATAVHFVYQGF